MVQWWYVLILCDYVPSGLPGQTLIQLWLQLTNETCVAWLLLIMCLAFYMTAGWGLLRPLSVLLFVYFFNRNKRLKYAKTVHKIVHSSCSSEYDNNISHAKHFFFTENVILMPIWPSNFTEICSWMSHYVGISLDNGLAPIRRNAII